MAIYSDQLNRAIELNHPPQKIISLVPSQTELLFDLGLDTEVIGITKFCIHPNSWFRNKTRIGGTKQLNLQLIRNLQPDLIIANKEENTQAELEILMQEFKVWISFCFRRHKLLLRPYQRWGRRWREAPDEGAFRPVSSLKFEPQSTPKSQPNFRSSRRTTTPSPSRLRRATSSPKLRLGERKGELPSPAPHPPRLGTMPQDALQN